MFDTINDVLYNKTGKFADNPEGLEGFSPYMMQRWASMYSEYAVDFLNCTVNSLYGVLDNNEMYKFMLTTLPKYKYKRINYIKNANKPKKRKKTESEDRIYHEENYNKLKQSMQFVFGE